MIALEPKINWMPFDKDNPPENLSIGEVYLIFLREHDGSNWTYSVDTATAFGSYLDGFWDTDIDWKEGQKIEVIAYASFPYALKEEELVDPSCMVEDPTLKALKSFKNMFGVTS